MKLRTALMLMVLLIFVMTGCSNTSPTNNAPESISFSESEEQTADTEPLSATNEQEVDSEPETSQDTELNDTNSHTSESNLETSVKKTDTTVSEATAHSTNPPTSQISETKPAETEKPPVQSQSPVQPPVESKEPEHNNDPSSSEPFAGSADCQTVAQKVLEYINSYRSTPATKLPGLTAYAEYRSRQLINNFAHDTNDQRAAATALQYGEYVEPSLYGMTGDPYYTANVREAIAMAGYIGSVDYVAKQLALQFKNSTSHWSYISDTKYQYIAVGVTYQNRTWYCAVTLTQTNTDNN